MYVIFRFVCTFAHVCHFFLQTHSGTSQRPEPRKAHEREMRKLRGELQQETQRHKATMERYHQQIEEIQHVSK